jgi:hypothetical protein
VIPRPSRALRLLDRRVATLLAMTIPSERITLCRWRPAYQRR